jgi:toluene monooxygenase system ferredoxin subunit
MMAFHQITTLEELWVGDMISRVVDGQRVLVLRLDDAVYAYADRCVHLGMPLSEGRLDGAVLTCTAHHYQYDARTGRGVNPRAVCLTTFPVKLEAGRVLVDVAAASGGERR